MKDTSAKLKQASEIDHHAEVSVSLDLISCIEFAYPKRSVQWCVNSYSKEYRHAMVSFGNVTGNVV